MQLDIGQVPLVKLHRLLRLGPNRLATDLSRGMEIRCAHRFSAILKNQIAFLIFRVTNFIFQQDYLGRILSDSLATRDLFNGTIRA